MVGAILVSHENLSVCMAETLAKITGETTFITPISSRGISPGQLEQTVIHAIESMKEVDGIILFTDLHGGSCSLVSSRIQRRYPEIVVITGVNLPLLIEYVFHRERPLGEIVDRIVRKGREGIQWYTLGGEESS